MNSKMTVTRAFSAGNGGSARNCSTPRAPKVQTEHRLSSAGIRALQWATRGSWSFGNSLESENRASKDNVFNNVVTPDSIPQFTIPSLSLQDSSGSVVKERDGHVEDGGAEETEETWGSSENNSDFLQIHHLRLLSTSASSSASSSSSSSSGYEPSPPFERRAHRSISDPVKDKVPHLQREGSFPSCEILETQHFPDPATRAALSLPHLPKVTTPYGFVTLSQSPQMANEEALFFQMGIRRRSKDEGPSGQSNLWTETDRRSSLDHAPIGASNPTPFVQCPSANDRGDPRQNKKPGGSSSSAGHTPAGVPKSRFWGVLRNHLTNSKDRRRV